MAADVFVCNLKQQTTNDEQEKHKNQERVSMCRYGNNVVWFYTFSERAAACLTRNLYDKAEPVNPTGG